MRITIFVLSFNCLSLVFYLNKFVSFSLIKAIEDLLAKDISDNKAIGKFGAEEILKAQNTPCIILTHCNTGSLATADYGTALGVIRSIHERSLIGMNQNIDLLIDMIYFKTGSMHF